MSMLVPNSRRKRNSSGAAMLEAVIVIPVLTLGLCGLLYYRERYLAKIATARLARAAVVAHGMAACKGPTMADWIDNDLGQFRMDTAGKTQLPAQAEGVDGSYIPFGSSASSRASSIIEKSSCASSDGKGFLNPVIDTRVSGQVSVSQNSRGFYEAPRTIFASRVQSESFASCSDEIHDGNFGQIIGIVKDELFSLFRR